MKTHKDFPMLHLYWVFLYIKLALSIGVAWCKNPMWANCHSEFFNTPIPCISGMHLKTDSQFKTGYLQRCSKGWKWKDLSCLYRWSTTRWNPSSTLWGNLLLWMQSIFSKSSPKNSSTSIQMQARYMNNVIKSNYTKVLF